VTDLRGKVAIVTGAGKGIGRASALALINSGCRVVAISRTREDLLSLQRDAEIMSGECHVHPGDVRYESDVLDTFHVAQGLGKISILVNAAGAAAFGPTESVMLDDWQRILDANVTGAFLCCREALRTMGEEGHIINIVSIAGSVAFPNSAAYNTSKWALMGLSKSLAAEVRAAGRHGIHVTALSPGSTDTPLWDTQAWSPEPKHMLRAEDVAEMVLYIVNRPPHMTIDEVLLMPSRGVL
jgi:NAD(P)-dependent dehydrogenase (short-subunit alcohol dehydrogenase family)